MGYETHRDASGSGLDLDLDLRACEVCRRELLPWQQTCPDDGGRAVRQEDLPPPVDPLVERLAGEDAEQDA